MTNYYLIYSLHFKISCYNPYLKYPVVFSHTMPNKRSFALHLNLPFFSIFSYICFGSSYQLKMSKIATVIHGIQKRHFDVVYVTHNSNFELISRPQSLATLTTMPMMSKY